MMTAALAACLGGAAVAQPGDVRLTASGARTFTIDTGEYRLEYGPEAGRKLGAGISITRRSMPDAAIFTRMAHGPSFNVTDYGTFIGYEHKTPKKDFSTFRSLDCKETPDAVVAVIRSRRTWADFEGTLLAYKATPGLVRWTVKVTARQDKAVYEPPLPDCEFRVKGGWGGHQVVRHMSQRGPASGIAYFRDLEMATEALYFEEFTSLSRLYELTGAANPWLGYTDGEQRGAVRMGPAVSEFQPAEVGGKQQPPAPYAEKVEVHERFGYLRPEGFRIPKGERLTIADTYLALRPALPDDNVAVCKAFVEMLAPIYRRLAKPPLVAVDWAGRVAPQLVKDLRRPENTHTTNGLWWPRAYVGYEHKDIQLWTVSQLLLPLIEYCRKHPAQKEAASLRDDLARSLPAFWDEKWQGFTNNLPPTQDLHYTGVYLLNPVYMVADIAAAGNADARRMLLGYRPKLLELGRNCGYVFADVSTSDLRTQKVLYQFDTTCMYLHIMMRLHQLSGGSDAEVLAAARGAADALARRRMDLCWEVNQTAIGAPACAWLAEAAGEARYRDLAYIPLANTLRWAWLWQGYYGIGKSLTTFWGFSGTPSNPHSCEYESHQVRRFMKDYVALGSARLAPDVRRMLDDCWQRGPTQSWFALPPTIAAAGAGKYMAPADGSESDCGRVAPDQMVPLEDFHGGWGTDMEWFQANSKLGQIGQEIYGAGGPFWYAVWQEELNAVAGRPAPAKPAPAPATSPKRGKR
jgi:hypothetical protein